MDGHMNRPFLHALLFLLLLCLTPLPAGAAGDGRYQAVVLHSAGASGGAGSISPKVFILDTREGHMWTWEQNARVKRRQGGRSFGDVLTYQGRLKVGSHAGQVIDERE